MAVTLAVATVTIPISHNSVVALLDGIAGSLHTDPAGTSWVATSTLIAAGVAMPLGSRIGEALGKRRALLVSLSGCAVGSVLCAAAANLAVLLSGRVLQGLAAGAVPLCLGLVIDHVGAAARARVVALLALIGAIGSVVGLPVAGAVAEAAGWRTVYALLAVLAGTAILAVLLCVPRDPVTAGAPLDAIGGLALGGIVVSVLLPLSQWGAWGVGRRTGTLLAVGALGAWWWTRNQLRHPSPFVDVRALGRRAALVPNLAGTLLSFAMFAYVFAIFRQLRAGPETVNGFGMSAVTAGACFVIGPAVAVASAPLLGPLARRASRASIVAGAALACGGATVHLVAIGSVAGVVVAAGLVTLGVSVGQMATTAMISAAVPGPQVSSANGINALLRCIGAATASAVTAVLIGEHPHTDDAARLAFAPAVVAVLVAAAAAGLVAATGSVRPHLTGRPSSR